MKRMLTIALMIGYCYTTTSCSAVATAEAMVFPETVSLQGTEKQIQDSVYLRYPFRVRLEDNTMYVMDIHPTDYYIHLFDYGSMRYKQSMASRGEVSAEFLSVENIRVDKQGNLWALDANKSKIVDLGKRVEEEPIQIELDKALVRTLDFAHIHDSVFVVPDYTGQHRISFVDHQGNIMKHAFQIPDGNSGARDNELVLAQAWRSFISYNPDHGILGMATQLGQVIEIYDLNKEEVIRIFGAEQGAPQFENRGGYAVPTGIMGYSDIHVGQAHIYALFWGASFDDIKKQGQDHRDGGRYVHVFDLKGNPVRRYVLDRQLTGFHIDEEQGRFIGLDINSNQPIVEYSFVP